MKNLIVALIITGIVVGFVGFIGPATGLITDSNEFGNIDYSEYMQYNEDSDETRICNNTILILPDRTVLTCRNVYVNNGCTTCIPGIDSEYRNDKESGSPEDDTSADSQNTSETPEIYSKDNFPITNTKSCPSICDDGNRCTYDYCSYETGYRCKYKYITPCCGNHVVEEGEDCGGLPVDTATCLTFGFDSGEIGCNSDCTFNMSGCIINDENSNTENGSGEKNENNTIKINEIMYNPTGKENYNEWIELYNPSEYDVDVSEWMLCGDALVDGYVKHTDRKTYSENGMLIHANGYALITDGDSGTEVYDNLNINNNSIALHTDAGSLCGGLSNTGKIIKLEYSENIIDEINYTAYAECEDGYSLVRISGKWRCSETEGGTPGSENPL